MTSAIEELLQRSPSTPRLLGRQLVGRHYRDDPVPWPRSGTTAWDPPATDVTEDSRWDLASVTKPIVAMAVMSLVERRPR